MPEKKPTVRKTAAVKKPAAPRKPRAPRASKVVEPAPIVVEATPAPPPPSDVEFIKMSTLASLICSLPTPPFSLSDKKKIGEHFNERIAGDTSAFLHAVRNG